mmetsp:Transcript_5626/g.7843  ORF Transcript_5626/g.7843 Transcript_5626/m.7843 type:complete len:477 (-) Transcript_5626:346-1776(-)
MYGSASSLADGLGGRGEPELEPPEDQGQRAHGLQRGELVAHALARAAAKGQERKVGHHLVGIEQRLRGLRVVARPVPDCRVGGRALEPVGVVREGLLPEVRVVVDVVHGDEQVHPAHDRHRVALVGLGQLVVSQRPADEQRRLGVLAQGLRDAQPHQLQFPDVLHGGRAVAHHRVHLGLHRPQQLRLLRHLEEHPGEHGGGGLVAGDEHGHEVVAQLLARGVLPPQVHQEPQQAGVGDGVVVACLKLLQVHSVLRGQRPRHQLVQHVVEHAQVRVEPAQPRHQQPRAGQVPVGQRDLAAVLHLLQQRVHRLHDRRLLGDGAEIVVEDALADDVQRDGAELLLHVHLLAALREPLQLVHKVHVALVEELHHALQPGLVEAGHDRAPPDLPGLLIGRDEPLPHDWIQQLCQHALVVFGGVIPQHVAGRNGVTDHQEALGPEAELVGLLHLVIVLVETQVHSIAHVLGHITLSNLTAVN